MPPPIFEIDELLRLVINELVETSPRSAVAFALTCRSLEEPTLSSLWKRQRSLLQLVKVLPQHTWIEGRGYPRSIVSDRNPPPGHILYQFPQAIEHDPTPNDWDRLQRYASWMRELSFRWEDGITDDTLSRLSCHSPDGVLCPKLEQLDWEFDLSRAPLSFFPLFFSSNLKRVTLRTRSPRFEVPPEALVSLAEVVSCLPSSLEHMSIMCGPAPRALEDTMSSFVCGCGSSLSSFGSSVPLSEAAFHHLMRLPNLRSWVAVHEPPRTLPPVAFPSLEELHLGGAALPWIHLLAARGEGEFRNGLAPAPAAITDTNINGTLRVLHCPRNTPVDMMLLSSISSFRNLVVLYVANDCCNDRGSCGFRLTDGDVEDLAVALPSLAFLGLGGACSYNSCQTTVSSLLSISIHCLELRFLEIHFNTRTIVSDIQRLLDGGSGRGKLRCELRVLIVGRLPLGVRGDEDIEAIAMGFADIFPDLKVLPAHCLNFGSWDGVAYKLRCS